MFLPAYVVYLPNFLFTYGMGVRGADRRRGEKFSNLGSLSLEIFHFFWYFKRKIDLSVKKLREMNYFTQNYKNEAK
jgi:hypothetical protein